jgi:Tol biopolymer transport system component
MTGRRHAAITVLVALVGSSIFIALPAAGALVPGPTSRVSVASDGTQGNGDSVLYSSISADGRYVAFSSLASNLVPGDTNGEYDVFVHDRMTGATTRANVTTGGAQSGEPVGGSPIRAMVSGDGRYVAFQSAADDLVAGDTNGAIDVFVHDQMTGTTIRVSVASDGSQFDGGSLLDAISADGRFIAFEGVVDVLVRDQTAGTTSRVALSSTGVPANDGSFFAAMSADGRYVAFTSRASNLVPGDTNAMTDVFVRDRTTSTTTRVSIAFNGAQANGYSADPPAISPDGRYVVFRSEATNLTQAPEASLIYVRDRTLNSTLGLGVAMGGARVGPPFPLYAVSDGGRYVTFNAATSEFQDPIFGQSELFVLDRLTAATTRVGLRSDGTPPTAGVVGDTTGLTPDGRYVTFTSGDDQQVPGDTNQKSDTFVRDLGTPSALAATPFGDFTGDGWPDLLSKQFSTGVLHLNQGTYLNLASRTSIGHGWNAMSSLTRLGDFDRDGHEDLIARESATGALWLYPGAGTTFDARVRIGRSGWNSMRQITPFGDVTADGWPDLLAVQSSTGILYLYPGHGTSFGARVVVGRSGWNAMNELTGVGDLTADGHPDLLARGSATGELWLYPGRAGGGFSSRIRVGTGWNSMRHLTSIGDVNRDGHNDLIAVQVATNRLFLYPWRGTSFGPRQLIGAGWTTDERPLL